MEYSDTEKNTIVKLIHFHCAQNLEKYLITINYN